MNLSLYHPEWGYYAAEPTQVGKTGDFFTNVSIGSMFGELLAHHIACWHEKNHIAGAWRILEPGPNHGQLARDIILALQRHSPEIVATLQYTTIDPSPIPLAWQRHHLADLAPTIQCLESPKNLTPLPTFLIANEILDALACRLFQKNHDQWTEIYIISRNSELVEELIPIEPAQTPAILLSSDLLDGYRTEVRDNWHTLLNPLLATISFGTMLWIDYGFAAPEYYHPARTKGTLRTYNKHQAGENPLRNLGTADITAHVDFTSFADFATHQNCTIRNFEPQEFFLTRIAATYTAKHEMNATEIRQLQTLIHPAQMGARFQILQLDYPFTGSHHHHALARLALNA